MSRYDPFLETLRVGCTVCSWNLIYFTLIVAMKLMPQSVREINFYLHLSEMQDGRD